MVPRLRSCRIMVPSEKLESKTIFERLGDLYRGSCLVPTVRCRLGSYPEDLKFEES